jgi:phenylpropionate dioxygenase-like ring-hydroxylating dioxygenase large terminal subunit
MSVLELSRLKQDWRFEGERTAPPDGFAALPDIPAKRYTSSEFFDLEQLALRNSWLYAIHDRELEQPGAYLRWERLGEPLFFVKAQDGRIRCFYNTCRHRGAPVVTQESGVAAGGRLVCGYHGWTYGLTGELKGYRDKRDFAEFDRSCRSLIEVRCEDIEGFYFVNLSGTARPLIQELGELGATFRRYQPQRMRHVSRSGTVQQCNAKVLQDAFMEVYHLNSVHPETAAKFLDHSRSKMTLWPHGHSIMVTPVRDDYRHWNAATEVTLERVAEVSEISRLANVSMCIFPNTIASMDAWGFFFLTFWPLSTRQTYFEVNWFGLDWGAAPRPGQWDSIVDNLQVLLREDTQFASAIQRSVESSGFRGIPLNYQERRIYYWHEEMDRRIGSERIPRELRVVPRFGDQVGRG